MSHNFNIVCDYCNKEVDMVNVTDKEGFLSFITLKVTKYLVTDNKSEGNLSTENHFCSNNICFKAWITSEDERNRKADQMQAA